MCGENGSFCLVKMWLRGSPPRVRGKPPPREVVFADVGITPACAGKTLGCPAAPTRSEDHPRVCGENCWKRLRISWTGGSPPRVRGKPALLTLECDGFGITPACAGKTRPTDSGVRRFWDHPRVCGENVVDVIRGIFGTGSPPRVRGKRAFALSGSVAKRITPACAGKTR